MKSCGLQSSDGVKPTEQGGADRQNADSILHKSPVTHQKPWNQKFQGFFFSMIYDDLAF